MQRDRGEHDTSPNTSDEELKKIASPLSTSATAVGNRVDSVKRTSEGMVLSTSLDDKSSTTSTNRGTVGESKEEITRKIQEQADEVRKSFSRMYEQGSRLSGIPHQAFQPFVRFPAHSSSSSQGFSSSTLSSRSSDLHSSTGAIAEASISSFSRTESDSSIQKRRRRSLDPKEFSSFAAKQSFERSSLSSGDEDQLPVAKEGHPPVLFQGILSLDESMTESGKGFSRQGRVDPVEQLLNRMNQSQQSIKLNCPPYEEILVNNNDVVCGRGTVTDSLIGNRRFRVLLDLHQKAYSDAKSDRDRLGIARSIVNAIRHATPSGRFVKMDVSSGVWVTAGDEQATEIVQKAMSERMRHKLPLAKVA